MNPLPPWANGPFDLLVHAEGHLRSGEDFDRRIALISFDNAIEVAITTYLTLHPIQRGNRTYNGTEVEKWLENYHSKLEFIGKELVERDMKWEVSQAEIIWAHANRNEQYHGGTKGTPEKSVLSVVRKAALWVFGLLFDAPDCEQRLESAIAAAAPDPSPERDSKYDKAIDDEYGIIEVGGQSYYASELLFSIDYAAYKEAGARLCQKPLQAVAKVTKA